MDDGVVVRLRRGQNGRSHKCTVSVPVPQTVANGVSQIGRVCMCIAFLKRIPTCLGALRLRPKNNDGHHPLGTSVASISAQWWRDNRSWHAGLMGLGRHCRSTPAPLQRVLPDLRHATGTHTPAWPLSRPGGLLTAARPRQAQARPPASEGRGRSGRMSGPAAVLCLAPDARGAVLEGGGGGGWCCRPWRRGAGQGIVGEWTRRLSQWADELGGGGILALPVRAVRYFYNIVSENTRTFTAFQTPKIACQSPFGGWVKSRSITVRHGSDRRRAIWQKPPFGGSM